MCDKPSRRYEVNLYYRICYISGNNASLKLWQIEHTNAGPASSVYEWV